ncbi:MAG: hypothetical protein PUB05_02700 [Firmicutes bacterium]|nr:hypothetical protein [Bacillota bacterium]
MRLFGIGLIALCGLAAGVYYAAKVRAELREAERLLAICKHIRYLVKYTQAPAAEIMSQTEQKYGEIGSAVFANAKSKLLAECRSLAAEMSLRLGGYQLEEQLCDCDRYIDGIKRCVDRMRDDCGGRAKIAFALCSTVGLALAIMLI